MNDDKAVRKLFGPIDPFCLLAVLPTVLIAALMATQAEWLLGLACVALAGLIILFDSWVNRPEPSESPHRRVRPQAPE